MIGEPRRAGNAEGGNGDDLDALPFSFLSTYGLSVDHATSHKPASGEAGVAGPLSKKRLPAQLLQAHQAQASGEGSDPQAGNDNSLRQLPAGQVVGRQAPRIGNPIHGST